jgi:hypothetical protein
MSLKTAMGKKHAKLRGVLRDNKPLKTHTPHSNRVGGFVASEQAVTFLRDARALLLRSKKWTKSSFGQKQKSCPICYYLSLLNSFLNDF